MASQFFVGRRVEARRLLSGLVPEGQLYGTRLIPVMVGPSGIGKTSLARKLQEDIMKGDLLPLFISAIKPPRTNEDLEAMLLKAIPAPLKAVLKELVRGVFKRVMDGLLGEGWEREAAALSGVPGRGDPLSFLHETLSGIAAEAGRKGYRGLVVVIDEAQNLLKGVVDRESLELREAALGAAGEPS